MLRPIKAIRRIRSPLYFSLHRYFITSLLRYFELSSLRNSANSAPLRYLFPSFDFSTVNSPTSPPNSPACSAPQPALPPAYSPRAPPPPDQPAPWQSLPPRSSPLALPACRAHAHSPAPQFLLHLPSPGWH